MQQKKVVPQARPLEMSKTTSTARLSSFQEPVPPCIPDFNITKSRTSSMACLLHQQVKLSPNCFSDRRVRPVGRTKRCLGGGHVLDDDECEAEDPIQGLDRVPALYKMASACPVV